MYTCWCCDTGMEVYMVESCICGHLVLKNSDKEFSFDGKGTLNLSVLLKYSSNAILHLHCDVVKNDTCALLKVD